MIFFRSILIFVLSAFLLGCSTKPKGPTIEIPNYYTKLKLEKELTKNFLKSIESADLISIMKSLHPDFVLYPSEVNTELTKNEFTGKVVELTSKYPTISFDNIELRPVLSPDDYTYQSLSLITMVKFNPDQETAFHLMWHVTVKDSSIYRIRQFTGLISGN